MPKAPGKDAAIVDGLAEKYINAARRMMTTRNTGVDTPASSVVSVDVVGVFSPDKTHQRQG